MARYEDNVNKYCIDSVKYKPGDMVLFNIANLLIGRLYAKFSLRQEGPFKIIRADSYWVYLVLPDNIKYTPVFYVNIVQFWVGRGLPGQVTTSDVRANDGRVIIRNDEQVDIVEWKFDKLFDCMQVEGNGYWYY